MTLPPYAKAIVAALAAGLAPVATDAATNPHGVTASTGVASVITALLGLVATYLVPNGQSASQKASGLVVTVKTDVSKFLAAFVAGIPALVQSAAEAAIQPSSAPAPEATAPEAVAEPAILGKATPPTA